MNTINIILAAVIGYLFGSFQTAFFVGKIIGNIDIRKYGSNNAGASNITAVIGWKWGVITAITDILKAALAVVIVGQVFSGSIELLFISGAFAIAGHIFPFYLKFKGGKGAASFIGMLLVIDIRIAVLAIVSIVALTILTDYIALGSISMFTILPIATIFLKYSYICTCIAIIVMIICCYKHTINIKRIINHDEVGLLSVIRRHNQ